MGVKITELLPAQAITFADLKGKAVAIDAYNHLYQFLSSIRTPTGELLSNSRGEPTSHLIGLFSRTTQLMQRGIRVAYVFDGKPPELKSATVAKRKAVKVEAERLFKDAEEKEDIEAMRRYASRTSRLTPTMVRDSEKLLKLLGIPVLQAPSEAEAQAAYMVGKHDIFAVSSQDADSFMFGAKRLVRNLSITQRRKKAGTLHSAPIDIQLIELQKLLDNLQITREQLIALSMLVGTDYAPGVRGVGPVKAHKMVKEHGTDFEKLFADAKWDEHNEVAWTAVYDAIYQMPVTDEYELMWTKPDKDGLIDFLCGEQDFSEEKVGKTVELVLKEFGGQGQKGLGSFF